jgi:hypothetical protein
MPIMAVTATAVGREADVVAKMVRAAAEAIMAMESRRKIARGKCRMLLVRPWLCAEASTVRAGFRLPFPDFSKSVPLLPHSTRIEERQYRDSVI